MFSAKRIFFLTVSIALVVSSCKTRKMIKTGDRLFEEGSYYNATEYYIPATEKKPNNTRLTYQIGAAKYGHERLCNHGRILWSNDNG